MLTDEEKAKRAAYMREYNQRPEAHRKKLLKDRAYRQNNLERMREYDRRRDELQARKAAKYASQKACRETNREEYLDYSKQYYIANRDRHKANTAKRRNQFTKEEWSDLQRRYGMKHRHGITPEQFDEMLIAQDGKCALCPAEYGEVGKAGRFHIDHDHVTGKVRGLLCMFCNHAIERLDNHDGWADRAQAYLRRPR